MADLSLDSPTSFRLVAAAAATVASLALVALGVQIGTDGLGADDPGRNRAATAASRSAAVVDLSRARSTAALDETLLSLVPIAPAAASRATPPPSNPSGTTSGPAGAPAPAPVEPATPAPAPEPAPAPVPVPAPDVPPSPALPDAAPILAPLGPVLEPVVEGVVEPLATAGASAETSPAPTTTSSADAGLLTTLAGLLGL